MATTWRLSEDEQLSHALHFSMKSDVSPCFASEKIVTEHKYIVRRIEEDAIHSGVCSAYLKPTIQQTRGKGTVCCFFTNDTGDQSVWERASPDSCS